MHFFINDNIQLWKHLWIFKSADSFAIPILIYFLLLIFNNFFLLALKRLFMQMIYVILQLNATKHIM